MKVVDFNGQSKALLKVQEAATLLSLSPRSIWNLIGMGELKAVRIKRSTRISAESLDDLIKRGSRS
jgi:excisionase family DNA binding protein